MTDRTGLKECAGLVLSGMAEAPFRTTLEVFSSWRQAGGGAVVPLTGAFDSCGMTCSGAGCA